MKEKTNADKISKKKKIKFILFTLLLLSIFLIVISEILLYLFHYESPYDKMKGSSKDQQAKWWRCDSVSGPGYVPNQLGKEDSIFFRSINENWYYNRLNIVNNEGYHDRDEFKNISPTNDSLKILFAGDSFTWGASADVDSSFVDIFENDVKQTYPAIVWNTGIPGTGTNHALFTTKKYLPIQKSNFVILGFYVGNDFLDNLTPFDDIVFYNKAYCINYYDYDENFKPFKISKRESFRKTTGSYPIEELNKLQKILIRSRLIYFISEIKDKLVNRLSGRKRKMEEKAYNVTKEYLKQLNAYVKDNKAELIVYVIPARVDLKEKEIHYLNTIKVLNQLSIKYFENINQFSERDYHTNGGGHLFNSGHIKAGHALSQYLLNYIKEKHLKSFKKAE